MGTGLFTVTPGRDSELFDTAFYRFLEARGWTFTDPNGPCALSTIHAGPIDTKVVSLWSDRAVADFEAFWPRYRQVYGDAAAERFSSQPVHRH